MTKKELLEALRGLPRTAEIQVYVVGVETHGSYAYDVYTDDKETNRRKASITVVAHI